jgi:hypothetical protein
LHDIWVRIHGFPDNIYKDYLALFALGSLIGKTREVDMHFTKEHGIVHMRFGCANPQSIPRNIDYVYEEQGYGIIFLLRLEMEMLFLPGLILIWRIVRMLGEMDIHRILCQMIMGNHDRRMVVKNKVIFLMIPPNKKVLKMLIAWLLFSIMQQGLRADHQLARGLDMILLRSGLKSLRRTKRRKLGLFLLFAPNYQSM